MPFAIDARDSGVPYQQKFDYGSRSDGQPEYIGWADPGVATSEAKWQIRKFTYDANGFVTAIQYAGGAPRFDQIYDNLASLSYA